MAATTGPGTTMGTMDRDRDARTIAARARRPDRVAVTKTITSRTKGHTGEDRRGLLKPPRRRDELDAGLGCSKTVTL